MPKLKTKSSVKKRFKTSSSGKLVVGNVGKVNAMACPKEQTLLLEILKVQGFYQNLHQ